MATERQPGRADRVGYKEIAEHLRQAIAGGEFGPGERVPSEKDLMAQFGVEQPTAWRALELLKNEGLVFSRRGSGTFVRDFQPVRRVSPDRLRSEVWGAGRSIWSADERRSLQVGSVRVAKEDAPAVVADVLDLVGEDRAVWVRRRVYLVEGQPVQTAVSYYPAALVDGSRVTDPDTGQGGVYARLAELGQGPVRFREELRARMPSADEVTSLGMHRGTPVIMIARTAFTAENVAIEYNEMVLDAGSFVLEYRFDA